MMVLIVANNTPMAKFELGPSLKVQSDLEPNSIYLLCKNGRDDHQIS